MPGRRPPSQVRRLAPAIRNVEAGVREPSVPVMPNPAHVHAEQGRSEPTGLPRNNELRGELARLRKEQRRTFDMLRALVAAVEDGALHTVQTAKKASQLLSELDPQPRR